MIPCVQWLLEAARAHDVHVVYTQDTHIEGDVVVTTASAARSEPGTTNLMRVRVVA